MKKIDISKFISDLDNNNNVLYIIIRDHLDVDESFIKIDRTINTIRKVLRNIQSGTYEEYK